MSIDDAFARDPRRYVAEIGAALPIVEAAERADFAAMDGAVADVVEDAHRAAAVIRGMAELVRFALSQEALPTHRPGWRSRR